MEKEKPPNKSKNNPLARVRCYECDHDFGLELDYMGIITCPYCGKYVEG